MKSRIYCLHFVPALEEWSLVTLDIGYSHESLDIVKDYKKTLYDHSKLHTCYRVTVEAIGPIEAFAKGAKLIMNEVKKDGT